MRRVLPLWLALALAASVPVFCAQPQTTPVERAAEPPSQGEHGELVLWNLANFLLLAGVLGYFIRKNAGPFFAGRNRKIRQDLVDAEDARAEAEKRAAEVESRLANLEGEIAALKRESHAQVEEEMHRVALATEAEIAKMRVHAEQEIASAGKAARTELKRYSAELAISLAEQRIRDRMNPQASEALVQGFVRHLDENRHAQST